MTVNFKKIFILIFVLFSGVLFSTADNAYKNELTKVSLSPVGASDVKVTLYMAKPYTEPLRLLKKNAGEFVLILPETYNSAPQKPSISDVIGEVTDADIKYYSFVANTSQNGYTKIVIKTNGTVNLYPEAVTVGGGHIANKPKEDIQKIVYEHVATTKTSSVNNTTPANQVQAQINNKPAETKDKKNNTTLTQQTTQNNTKNETDTLTNKEEKKILTPPADDIEIEPIMEPPVLSEISEINQEEIPPEEISFNNTEVNENTNYFNKTNFLVLLKNKLSELKPKITTDMTPKEATGNILVTLISVLLMLFSIKFAINVIRSVKPKEDEFANMIIKDKSSDKNKDEYSDFFKTLINAERNGNNPFSFDPPIQNQSTQQNNITPVKSHQEVLNVDQNLSWQDKFRTLQKNKKSLLKSKDDTTEIKKDNMRISENMNIENPINKLKQDFKAVRKVLERQQTGNIGKDFVPEKIENVEIISFEDFQKNIEKPKVQINKTVPIKSKPPKVLTRLELGKNKGLYLVEYKGATSLIGYINDKVFKLNSYSSVRDSKLYARLSDRNGNNETYIVKFDNNKMLIDVNDEQIRLKLMY